MSGVSLLARLGIGDRQAWQQRWQTRLAQQTGPTACDSGLLWGLVLPLLTWLENELAQGSGQPVIGLQAPIGAGKTTLAAQVQRLARSLGCELAVASIDDAYLDWHDRQVRLAGNPFGVNRVPPGSHDPLLLLQAIDNWRQSEVLRLPRFDKTLREGHGDRCGWVEQPAQALLLEGWLLGYAPVSGPALLQWLQQGNHDLNVQEQVWMPRWNAALADYQPLWAACGSLWVIEPQTWDSVRHWRLEAEAAQRRQGGAAMDSSEVEAMVRASLASLPPTLYQAQLRGQAMAVAQIDGLRRCLQVTPTL